MKSIKTKKILFVLPIVLLLIGEWIIYRKNLMGCPFVDYTYQIENAYRIYVGQIPYKDFFLVLTPGTYYILAGFFKIFGATNTAQIIMVMVVQAANFFLVYWLLHLLDINIYVRTGLASICAVGGHLNYHFAYYDYLSITFILVEILLMVKLLYHKTTVKHKGLSFTAIGFFALIPFLVKQNYGIMFAVGVLFFLLCYSLTKRDFTGLFYSLLGAFIVTAAFVAWLQYHGMLRDFVYQTYFFPRDAKNAWGIVGRTVKALFLSRQMIVVNSVFLACILVSKIKYTGKWVWALFTIFLFIYRYFWGFNIWATVVFISIVIWITEVVLKGDILSIKSYVFLSIGIVYFGFCTHNTNAYVWLLVLLLAFLYQYFLRDNKYKPAVYLFIILLFSTTLYVSLTYEFTWIDTTGENKTGSTEKLETLGANGPWIPEMEKLAAWIENDLGDDSFIEIPCEDPIYWLTETNPQLNFFQLYPETCPYNVEEVIAKISENNIKWVIVKKECQFKHYLINESNVGYVEQLLTDEGYKKFDSNNIYDIFYISNGA